MVEEFAMRRRRGRSRGQALVEFALIAPLFVLTFFGAIEMSLIIASLGAYNFAVRDAARVGSILGRTDPYVDFKILKTISAHVSGLVMAKATEIDIYRAASDGSCLNAQSGPATSVSVDDPTCAKGVYDNTGTLVSGGWAVDSRDDALVSADYVGVRIVFNYTFITGFVGTIGTSLTLSSTSAQRIEPQDFNGHRQPSTTAPASGSQASHGARAPSPSGDSGVPLWQPALTWKEVRA
jgi:Flp pilus assembly protein TadG